MALNPMLWDLVHDENADFTAARVIGGRREAYKHPNEAVPYDQINVRQYKHPTAWGSSRQPDPWEGMPGIVNNAAPLEMISPHHLYQVPPYHFKGWEAGQGKNAPWTADQGIEGYKYGGKPTTFALKQAGAVFASSPSKAADWQNWGRRDNTFVHRAEVFGILRWLATFGNNIPSDTPFGYALRIPRFNAGAVNQQGFYQEQCEIPNEPYRQGRDGRTFGRFWLGNRDKYQGVDARDDDSADRYRAFEQAVVDHIVQHAKRWEVA